MGCPSLIIVCSSSTEEQIKKMRVYTENEIYLNSKKMKCQILGKKIEVIVTTNVNENQKEKWDYFSYCVYTTNKYMT